MKPKPENWKQRALKAEEDAKVLRASLMTDSERTSMFKAQRDNLLKDKETLRVERDAAERRYQEMVVKAEMPRPSVTTTTRTVNVSWLFWLFFFIWFGEVLWMENQVMKLQTPIREPYPVKVAAPEYTIGGYKIEDWYNKTLVCQDAWRADEKTIRKLEREKP
jgi:hypothetical protein